MDKPKVTIPNLFIIGSMKSGTTSLHEYLDEHPEIFMSVVKEPGYFSDCVNYYPKDLDWYLNLFGDVKNEKIVGESSTHYTKLPLCQGVIEKIAEFSPDARFIYIMRNPIERTISHYWHNIRNGTENRDMLSAINESEQYIAFSDYAYQLKPYIERFGINRLYTLTFEELVSDPEKSVKEILHWLGVDSGYKLTRLGTAHNELPAKFHKVKGSGLLYRFRNSAFWNAIAPLIPKKLKSSAASLTVEETSKSKDQEVAVRAYLRPIFVEKVIELESLLNKKFDRWKL